MIRIFILLLALVTTTWADELEIKVNQAPVKLPYWPAIEPHYGAVIIVRGGLPAQWSESLASLAPKLAANGWSTVLLNCLADSSTDWVTQLPEAIGTLRQNKNNRIVVVHYGEQMNVTLDYFSKPQAKMINGLVLLSAYDMEKALDKPPNLRFPLLDIVGQFDYEMVENQYQSREKLLKSSTYTNLKLPGASHDFDYNQAMLAAFMSGWMLRLQENATAAPPVAPGKGPRSYLEPIYPLSQLVAIK